jgi:hypothetical protein
MANRLKRLEIAKAIPRLDGAGDVAPLGLGPVCGVRYYK